MLLEIQRWKQEVKYAEKSPISPLRENTPRKAQSQIL